MYGLTDEQEAIRQAAINWFYNEPDQVFQIAGAAGTGKTYLIYHILNSLNLNANQFLAMSYTGQASIVMRTRGFKTAKSIHSSLYEVVEYFDDSDINIAFNLPKKKRVFKLRDYIEPEIRLFFIDEAFMVPAKMVKDILSFGIKVIVCGDPNQLPPVGDDPGFLISGKIHRLTKLMRQAENNPIVYLANRAKSDLPIHCGVYGHNNEVLVIKEDEIIPEMFMYSECTCCGTNRTREILNENIRKIFGYNTQLPNVGERVICRQNNWNETLEGISLCNGLNGICISPASIDPADKSLFILNFKPDLVDNYFRNLRCNKDYFLSPYNVKKEMKSFDRRYIKGEYFEFAYALTTHLCQGSEYSQGIYIEEYIRPQMQNSLNYTGITRFKNKLIYIKKVNKYY